MIEIKCIKYFSGCVFKESYFGKKYIETDNHYKLYTMRGFIRINKSEFSIIEVMNYDV